MGRGEFELETLSMVFSKLVGECTLDIFLDTPSLKKARYKSSEGKLMIVAYAPTWIELYEKFSVEVHQRGLLTIKTAVKG